MKQCESCKFRHTYEWEKPCMGYHEGCQLYQKGEDMTRDEAIKELSEMRTDAWTDSRQMEALDMAIKALEQEPKTGHWIPVSERLPEDSGDYLVAYEKGYAEDYDLPPIGIAGFEVDCESFGYWYEYFDRQTMGSLGSEWEEIKVVAWMPLPKPYEPQTESEE